MTGLPRDAPKSSAGWVRWGTLAPEHVYLSEPQMRAFETLMREAPKTTTKRARAGRSTRICEHEVVLSAMAVNALVKHGLVVHAPKPCGPLLYMWHVKPTERARRAWKDRESSAPRKARNEKVKEATES